MRALLVYPVKDLADCSSHINLTLTYFPSSKLNIELNEKSKVDIAHYMYMYLILTKLCSGKTNIKASLNSDFNNKILFSGIQMLDTAHVRT